MTATTAQRRAVNEWLTMLEQVESAIARSMDAPANADEHEMMEAAEDTKKHTSRIDRRIRKLSERVAAAERSAEEVTAELARAEADLRRWVEQVRGVSQQISDMRQVA